MLGAYYYPWYGKHTPPILGMGDWKEGYSNEPLLGKYNSREETVINQHISWAKEAGIDFFAVEWSGPHTWEDITLKDHYLPTAKGSGIKFCINYDSSLTLNKLGTLSSYDFNDKYSPTKTIGQKFVDDFKYLADTYFSHPQYFKIDSKPVVIIYNAFVFQNFSEYFEKLMTDLAKKNIHLFLIADAVYWTGLREFISKKQFKAFLREPFTRLSGFYQLIRRSSAKNVAEGVSLDKYFGGISGYNLYDPDKVPKFLGKVDKIYQKFWDQARLDNICFIPTVMPGYDDRNLRDLSRPVLEREEGKFYKEFWEIAKKYLDSSLKIVLINSFNEWHEGTAIEPSKEYGNKYLKLTKSLKNEAAINQS